MATKKYEVGGMTEAESCGKPGKPRCKKTFKSKGKSKETKGSLLGTIGAGILGSLGGYAAYKKLKEQKKGGATKYQNGGSTNTTATEPPKSKKIKLNNLIIHTEGAKLAQRKAMKKMEDRRHKKQQTGGATKYKTGGMVNANANLKATATAGSKGVKSGVNPKAIASKVARGRSGGTSTAPKTATPKAKYGMSVKKYGDGGGTSKSSMYGGIGRSTGNMTPARTSGTTTMTPVEKAKARYGMTVKRKK
jgi:hypothetical protein